VAASTGLRLGELAGLRWNDINLAASRVTVAQQFTHDAFTR
jgi:integrase